MFTKERHAKILDLLAEKGKITVSGLSRMLMVSEVTIRKDLDLLEQQHQLKRIFGGAIANDQTQGSSCFIPPESLNDYASKKSIGALAASLVQDEDFIFLGPGYTCLEVARNLKSKQRLAVTTMNISAAIELAGTQEFKIFTVPGDFTKRNGTYYVTGSVLIDYFSNSYFDKIFLTMDGISLTRGFSVLDDVTARIYQVLQKHTNQVIVCATAGKFGKNAMAEFGPLSIIDTIVTDGPIPEEFKEYFDEYGICVIMP